MANKTIYDLTENQSLDADDLFEQDVLQNNERKSLKTTLRAIADKIISSLTYSSLNTTSKTVVGAINELEQGGGTGGHTIIDENGNSMTARANLQFTGAVEVLDDNVNNKTIVDVQGGDFYNPVIYSLEEREIGVWVNGKPLYEKTLYTNTQVQLSDDVWTTIPWVNEPTDVDFLVSAEVTRQSPNNNSTLRFTLDSGHIKGASLKTGNYPALNNITEYLKIRYTKTTDVAGSGSWTPQGVPTHHYSTDEHIVGTWIDGSTLYEKTWYCSSIHAYDSNKQGSVLATGFTDYKEIIDFRGSYKGGTANAWGDLNGLTNHTGWNGSIHVNPNGDIVLFASSNANNISSLIGGKAIVTIQYTKSS